MCRFSWPIEYSTRCPCVRRDSGRRESDLGRRQGQRCFMICCAARPCVCLYDVCSRRSDFARRNGASILLLPASPISFRRYGIRCRRFCQVPPRVHLGGPSGTDRPPWCRVLHDLPQPPAFLKAEQGARQSGLNCTEPRASWHTGIARPGDGRAYPRTAPSPADAGTLWTSG